MRGSGGRRRRGDELGGDPPLQFVLVEAFVLCYGGVMPRRTEASPYTAKVGARIRELRLARNMSLADVANAANLSKGHLSSVEHGLAAINIETIERLARGLSLPPMYIFVFVEEDERARIADLIRDFPKGDLARLRREIQARRKAPKG
jgi:transcriptional regulator with XRE-family HTH domain